MHSPIIRWSLWLLLLLTLNAQAVIDRDNATSVGNIGLTVTNYGVLGNNYEYDERGQPSCMYKLKSELEFEQVEHISLAGLWIGGKVSGTPRVSTGVIDGGNGWEWNPTTAATDTIRTRSSIITSRYYHPDAVSHQDFECTFTDTVITSDNQQFHVPLGLEVELSTYAWNYSYADAFVILSHKIRNITDHWGDEPKTIDSVFVGYWIDEAVHNYMDALNGDFYWYDNLAGVAVTDGMTISEGDTINMVVGYDADGDDGYAESLVGVRFLGAEGPGIDQNSVETWYNFWEWNNHGVAFHPDLFMPGSDAERFSRMHSRANPAPEPGAGYFPYPEDPDAPASWMMLASAGPFGSLAPGEEITVVYAIVTGERAPLTDPTAESWNLLQQRAQNLIRNSNWAQIAYNGEDTNGNHILDPGEDQDGDGEIDRYLLSTPPPAPNLALVVRDQQVDLYWNDIPEPFIDPVLGRADFEGYRVYSSVRHPESGAGRTMLAQFDLVNAIPPNTGLEQILLPVDTLINDIAYQYRFTVSGLQNGSPEGNWFSVSAFDQGDPAANLASLESSIYENWAYAFPGTEPTDTDKPFVFPNPYRGHAGWDGPSADDRLIWFANLPVRCQIKVYTLSGDFVMTLNHDGDTYRGENYRPFSQLVELLQDSPTVPTLNFSGGMHAWNLVTRYDQALATGMYLFSVENLDSGHVDVGKFLVIK